MSTIRRIKFNWVIKDELAVGSAPTKKEHLKFLENNGIKSVLSVCSNEEADLSQLLNSIFYHTSIPLPDHTYKNKLNVKDLLNAVKAVSNLRKNGPVYVHCYAGIERSPIVCMAWLIRSKGLSPIESLDYLMNVNKGTNPLLEQFEVLKNPLLVQN